MRVFDVDDDPASARLVSGEDMICAIVDSKYGHNTGRSKDGHCLECMRIRSQWSYWEDPVYRERIKASTARSRERAKLAKLAKLAQVGDQP